MTTKGLPDADLSALADSPAASPGVKPDPDPHPRDAVMEGATKEFIAWLNEWHPKYQLTASEVLFTLAAATGRITQHLCLLEREKRG